MACKKPGFVERTVKKLVEDHNWVEIAALTWVRALAKDEDIEDDTDTDTDLDSDGGEPVKP